MSIHSPTALRVASRKRAELRLEWMDGLYGVGDKSASEIVVEYRKWKRIYYALAYGASPRAIHEGRIR